MLFFLEFSNRMSVTQKLGRECYESLTEPSPLDPPCPETRMYQSSSRFRQRKRKVSGTTRAEKWQLLYLGAQKWAGLKKKIGLGSRLFKLPRVCLTHFNSWSRCGGVDPSLLATTLVIQRHVAFLALLNNSSYFHGCLDFGNRPNVL